MPGLYLDDAFRIDFLEAQVSHRQNSSPLSTELMLIAVWYVFRLCLHLSYRKGNGIGMHLQLNKVLPIGTAVSVFHRKCIIIGIRPEHLDYPTQECDYVAVSYPLGYVGEQHLLYFNHRDIDSILLPGYADKDREDLLQKIREYDKEEAQRPKRKTIKKVLVDIWHDYVPVKRKVVH